MRISHQQILSLLLSAVALTIISCTQPAPASGFLEKPARMSKSETAPYQLSWKKPDTDFTKYHKIKIAPVSTEHTRMRGIALENWHKPSNKIYLSEINTNAKSLEDTFAKAFESVYPNRWSADPSHPSLNLELHLVEIAPSQPLLQTAGFFVTGGGFLNQPSVAIEGRFRDSHTNEVIATFADRRKGDIALLDLSKLQSYQMHRKVMAQWARQTVIWISIADGQKVPRPNKLKLITW